MNYYIVRFDIMKEKYYTIWYLDYDGRYLITSNRLIFFNSYNNIINYCNDKKLALKEVSNIDIYDINYLLKWIKNISIDINCSKFLDFWNTISDITHSIQEHFYGDEDGKQNEIVDVYNRLFYGCNIEAIRKDGEMYYPKWDDEDIQIIKNVVKDGLRILSKALNIDLSKELKDNE